MPIESLAEFVIYLLPGFIAVELFRSRYPVRKRSDFIIISWSIVYGIIISSLVLKFDSLFFGLKNDDSSDISNFRLIAMLFAGGLIGGSIRIGINNLGFIIGSRFYRFQKLIPDSQSIWAKLNNLKEKEKWALVVLDDGTKYLGYIEYYSYVPDLEDQEFLLSNAKKIGDNWETEYIVDGLGVYINTKNVKRIEYLNGDMK